MADKPLGTVEVDVAGLADGGTRMFRFVRDDEPLSGFVVKHRGALFAYVNRCPHAGYSLDFGDGRVMDPTGKFVQCMSHGAAFLPESGKCILGPALGQSLERLPAEADEERLTVTIPPASSG